MSDEPRVIAVVNQKGGTAKTTTTVNLAAAWAEMGRRVALIDLDPQGSATRWLDSSPSMALANVISEGAPLDAAMEKTGLDGLELVPASKELASADRQLTGEVGIQTALRDAIAGASHRDIVVIDCQPSLGLLSVMALAAAPEALVPVGAGSMELDGIAELRQTIERIRQRLHPALRISNVLACRIDRRGSHLTNISSAVLDSLRRHFPNELLRSVIHESTRLKEAPSHRMPITTYDPDGQGARDYRAAARELVGEGRHAL